MENEKKPKRPRIGASLSSSVSTSQGGENHYEKVNYPERQSSEERPYQSRPYQPRPYSDQPRPAYRSYSNRESGYQPRPQSDYRQTAAAEPSASTAAEGTERTSEQHPYQQRQGGYQQRPYQQRQGNYQKRPGGYQQRQGGYNNRNNQYRNNQQGGNRPGGYNRNNQQQGEGGYQQRPYQQRQGGYQQRPGGYNNRNNQYRNNQRPFNQNQRKPVMRFTPRPKQIDYVLEDLDLTQPIRLNKFMANSGICSRREADELIAAGKVKVNGEVVTELGTKIQHSDVVECNEKVVTPERKCYVLLNKPKDCVTTSDDPNGRTTVLDLVKNACQERIYPVGRLDRNTTGVLLLTNDGDLASKLTHPKFVKKKIYHVWTDKPITPEDMQRIADGIELEDGEIHADAVSYVSDTDFNQAGIEIHSGRNRIVRRIFEHLGYRVTKLDRVYFAGLTKKNLPRGRWRYLTQEEVNFLRMGSFE